MAVSAELLILTLILFLPDSESVVYKKEHSFAPPFEGQTDIFRNWYFLGATSLHEGLVRLTAEEPMTQGAVWSAHPCYMKDWEMQIHFRIYGQEQAKYGNGIAIWYTKEALHLGPVFGNKDYFTGLGVFIDTHENVTHPHKHHHPYVSAMINNGSVSYKHDDRGTVNELGGCHVRARNQPPGIPTAIAISYIQNTLTVFTDTEGHMQWMPCFRAENIFLPPGYFFGISASTDWLIDFHDVITVTTLDMTTLDSGMSESQVVDSEVEAYEYQDVQEEKAEEEEETDQLLEKPRKQEPIAPILPEEKIVDHGQRDHVHEPKAERPKEQFFQQEFERQKESHKHSHEKKKVVEEKEVHQEQTVVVEEVPKKMSWLKILMYTVVITVVGVFSIRWFASYNARRKEKIRKRLY